MKKNDQVIVYRYFFSVRGTRRVNRLLMEFKSTTFKLIKDLDASDTEQPVWKSLKKANLNQFINFTNSVGVNTTYKYYTLNDSPEYQRDFFNECWKKVLKDISATEKILADIRQTYIDDEKAI